jgi:hypothetical protein
MDPDHAEQSSWQSMLSSSAPGVHASAERGVVTIAVGGALDETAGAALIESLREELDRGPIRVQVDLTGLESFTEEGATSLATCHSLGTGIPEGLHFRTEPGAGQEALLVAFATESDDGEEFA